MYRFSFLTPAGNLTFEHESYVLVVLALVSNVVWLLLCIFGIDLPFTGIILSLGFICISYKLDSGFYAFNSDTIDKHAWEIRMVRLATNLTAAIVAVTLNGVLGMTIFMSSPKGLFSFFQSWLSQMGFIGIGRLYFLVTELMDFIRSKYNQPQSQPQHQRPTQTRYNQQPSRQQNPAGQLPDVLEQLNQLSQLNQQIQQVMRPPSGTTQGQGAVNMQALISSALSQAILSGAIGNVGLNNIQRDAQDVQSQQHLNSAASTDNLSQASASATQSQA